MEKIPGSCPSSVRTVLYVVLTQGSQRDTVISKSLTSSSNYHLQEPGFQIKFLWLSGKNLSTAEMLPLSASSDVLTTKCKGKTMSCFLSP